MTNINDFNMTVDGVFHCAWFANEQSSYEREELILGSMERRIKSKGAAIDDHCAQ
jgi:hypothetical protein